MSCDIISAMMSLFRREMAPCGRRLSTHRLISQPLRALRVIAEPPLPSALADGDRTGAITAESDAFSSRKLQGKQGAFKGRDVVPMWIADVNLWP